MGTGPSGARTRLKRRRYRVLLIDEAKAQFTALPPDAQVLVAREISDLVTNPRHPHALAMWGEWTGHWRVRVGVYRVIYRIDDPSRVFVVKIGPRGSVYRRS